MRSAHIAACTLWELCIMAWLLRVRGLSAALERCKKMPLVSVERDQQQARAGFAIVDRLCRWYSRSECLHRAVVGYVALRKAGLDVQLVIGVRKFPFAAHAWLECEGVVISDEQDVQQQFVPSMRLKGVPTTR